MADVTTPNIDFIVIPRSCSSVDLWGSLVQKFKAFRLFSLQESPEAFSSTYAREVAFPDDVWAGRLANVQATAIVAVRNVNSTRHHDDTAKVRALVDEDWLATTFLIQPEANSPATLSASRSPWESTATDAERLPPSDTLLFILNG